MRTPFPYCENVEAYCPSVVFSPLPQLRVTAAAPRVTAVCTAVAKLALPALVTSTSKSLQSGQVALTSCRSRAAIPFAPSQPCASAGG